MASSLSNIAAKDGTSTTVAGGILAVDKSGAGTGPFAPAHAIVDTQGTNTATVKAATTAVASGDTALAVGLHPTSPLPAGTNVIGHVIVDTAPSTAVTNAGTFAVQAAQATAASLNATVVPSASATWGLGTTTQNSTAATLGTMALAEFNTTPTTITSGNMSPLQMDNAGNLLVNIKAGAGSGGTALADEATFTEGTTSFTPIGGVFKTSQTALTTGQGGAVALSAAREMMTLSKNWDGTNTAAVKAASTAPVATDPALVVAISPNSVNANGQTTMSASAPVTIASDQSALKALPAVTATANGATASRINAAASTNATSLKASAGQLYTLDVFNNAAYNVFIKFYNKASSPTVGTDTPVATFPIQAGGGFSKTWPMGFPFSTGIAYAITKLQADSDTTVLVAGDLTGNTIWI